VKRIEALWSALEEKMAAENAVIHESDIPWPDGKLSVIGVVNGDERDAAKKKLAVALRRWHPDKWRRILNCVPKAEQDHMMQRVKEVAQRLLQEKAKLTGPGGILS